MENLGEFGDFGRGVWKGFSGGWDGSIWKERRRETTYDSVLARPATASTAFPVALRWGVEVLATV